MTWTYSGDPSESDLDAIRFYVQDTDTADQLITDEEIEFLIAQWTPVYGNNLMVASMVAEAIAAKFTREVAYSADGVSVGVQDLQDKYNNLALSLRDQYKQYDIGSGPVVGGILYAEAHDPTIKPTLWSVGMHDNARAGNQETGTSASQNYELGGESGVPG
jgi:hypothetical protein